MEKIKFNFTDEELKSLIYQVVNENEYWINKFDRAERDTLNGTIVGLKPLAENSNEQPIEIQFLHDKLEVSGLTAEQTRKLYKLYYNEVFKKVPEYSTQYEMSKEEIKNFVTEYGKMLKNLMTDLLYEGGFESLEFVKNKIKTYKLAGTKADDIRLGNHVTYTQLRPNKLYTPEREIKVGEVYMTDLNPVVDTEFGGVRPCLIIGYTADRKNYICVPLSTKHYMGTEIGIIDGEESYAVVSRMKIVSKERFYEFICGFDQTKYTEIIEEVAKNHLIISNPSLDKKVSLAKQEKEAEEIEVSEPVPQMLNQINAFPQNSFALDMIESNLVQLTEEEVYEIAEKWAKNKRTMRFTGAKGNKLEYKYETKGEDIILRFNTKYTNAAQGYHPVKITFKRHEVRTSIDESEGKKDISLTLAYQKKRMQKDDKYYVSLFFSFVRRTNMSYSKQRNEDYDGSMLDEKIEQLKRNTKNLNISYNGNYMDLVERGVEAITSIELISYDEDEIENE